MITREYEVKKMCRRNNELKKKGGGGMVYKTFLETETKSIRNKYFIFLNVVKLMQVSLNGLKGHITIK